MTFVSVLLCLTVHLTLIHAYTNKIKLFIPNKEISGVHVNNSLL